MNNTNGLTEEQKEIAIRASNLENREYIRMIEEAMDNSRRVEVVVTNKEDLDKYEFYIGD